LDDDDDNDDDDDDDDDDAAVCMLRSIEYFLRKELSQISLQFLAGNMQQSSMRHRSFNTA
jgi:hypothetical protein